MLALLAIIAGNLHAVWLGIAAATTTGGRPTRVLAWITAFVLAVYGAVEAAVAALMLAGSLTTPLDVTAGTCLGLAPRSGERTERRRKCV